MTKNILAIINTPYLAELGDYSGYQYDYSERDSFYRQWWLANERTIIFIVYQCAPESTNLETEEIDKIVRSITVINA